jgi:hypothetical protein
MARIPLGEDLKCLCTYGSSVRAPHQAEIAEQLPHPRVLYSSRELEKCCIPRASRMALGRLAQYTPLQTAGADTPDTSAPSVTPRTNPTCNVLTFRRDGQPSRFISER